MTARTTIAALKKKTTDVAFYLRSRALWLRSWDGAGYKPIQGPVQLTGRITLPLPRAINFTPENWSTKRIGDEPVIDQEHVNEVPTIVRPSKTPFYNIYERRPGGLITHNPDGTPVPSSTPPPGVPSVNALQQIGNRVFEMGEYAPKSAKIGVAQTMNARWKVVAVPIRASQKACLPCHTYRPRPPNRNATTRTTIEVGDALGVAFYLYSVAKKRQERTQALRDASIH